jgi:thiamine pyrophosphokinase
MITLVLANKIICLDGAINKLKKYFENDPISRGPDFVIGDFDSIDPQSIKWLEDTVKPIFKQYHNKLF